jgi:hypothetical protein
MVIERNSDTITIRLNASLIDMETVQKFVDYFGLLESNAQNKGTQEHADELAYESHKNWLVENQDRINKL